MLIEPNQTYIQMIKLMYKQNGKKPKKTSYQTVYPRAVENRYKNNLSSYFKPLVDYVDKFLAENGEALLRGDSKTRKDVLPGGTFQRMIRSLEGWVSTYMPTVLEQVSGQNDVIFMGLGQTANQIKEHQQKQFTKELKNGINVQFQSEANWWPNVKDLWTKTNYELITSNARNYISSINNLAERAVVNGWSYQQLKDEIKKASDKLTDSKCKLLARDQIGKLQGMVSEAQMEEVGLSMYIWSTSGDERVRSTHIPMDGLLCRWDDASVYSDDNGKSWKPRPSGAVTLHPGMDIQCRCVALVYTPELIGEVEDKPIEEVLPPVIDKPKKEVE